MLVSKAIVQPTESAIISVIPDNSKYDVIIQNDKHTEHENGFFIILYFHVLPGFNRVHIVFDKSVIKPLKSTM